MLVKYIKNGNIQQSLEHVCLILHMNDERITEIENDFIEICNFIGLNMEFEHAKRWFDIVNSTYQFITNETMKVDDVLVLCSKMCSLCKLINENTVINMKSLRSQVINELVEKINISKIEAKSFTENINRDSFHYTKQFIGAIEMERLLIDYKRKNKNRLDMREFHLKILNEGSVSIPQLRKIILN